MSLVDRLLAMLLLAMPGSVAAAEPLRGPVARIVDGDTFDLAGARIRLWGVDAPEDDQPGGKAATATLARLVDGGAIACERKGRDHARVVARCRLPDGRDVAAELVRSGYAMDYRRYSRGAYADQQKAARAALAGLWADGFVPPWRWRRR
jgi:endonuclease YncB( thermonuclease family)